MKTLLAGAHILKLEKIVQMADAITLFVSSAQTIVNCPSCREATRKVHSRYERTIADLPWEGIPVRLQLRVRKFFCRNPECQRRIFCERLPEVATRCGRRTYRMNEALSSIGFALGGRPGAKTATKLGLQTGADSILRRVRDAAASPTCEMKVRTLGVDDWALKKGQNYGTILVDLEKRRAIDLLKGREAAPLEEWLKKHPEIEVIARDRAGAYADGSRKGAPQAQQVADRWHLLKNANEAFQRLIQRQQKVIREAIEKLPVPQQVTTADEGATPAVVPETASEYMRSRSAREQRQAFHVERKARYDQVQELKQQGFTIVQIKKHLGFSYNQVVSFYQADEYPVIKRSKGLSQLDEFDDFLRERWSSGCHNAGQLYSELCEKGYTGSGVTIRRHVQLWRANDVKTLPPVPKKIAVPGPWSCVWLLLKEREKLKEEERLVRQAVLDASPVVGEGLKLVESFREAIGSRSEDKLVTWMIAVAESQIPEFNNFVMVLRRDEAAVRAAASSAWSNGQTEGQVNRLKMLKRQMYGRANFDLLRARVLNAP